MKGFNTDYGKPHNRDDNWIAISKQQRSHPKNKEEGLQMKDTRGEDNPTPPQ